MTFAFEGGDAKAKSAKRSEPIKLGGASCRLEGGQKKGRCFTNEVSVVPHERSE